MGTQSFAMDRNGAMLGILVICVGALHIKAGQDTAVKYIAENIQPKFSVVNNWASEVELEFTNAGDSPVSHGDWEIFLCHIRLFEPGILTPNYTEGIPVGNTGLELYHINGCLYKLVPTTDFALAAGETIKATVVSSDWMVARTDVMPNWYVTTTSGDSPQTIQYTIGEDLNHVGEFDTPEKWKRTPDDQFNPPTPQDRYSEYAEDEGSAPNRLIPSPLSLSLEWSTVIETDNTWQIVSQTETENEANYLKDKTGWTISSTASTKFVSLVQDEINDTPCGSNTDEAYRIEIDAATPSVTITAPTTAGIFYGVQTCLGVLALNGDEGFYPGTIIDCPRFPFRGLMIDVSRNFVAKSTILDMLNVMAMYKLNKFHFHLSDDEAWRLQINGLPELTEIGGRRCHNLAEDECIIPQLGSDPSDDFPGSGYYNTTDYQEILMEATRLHIEVIPEFDMPGHAHAAIKAMEARYRKTNDTEYLLSDFEDKSQYYSAQHFWDSALNPCMPSVANFVETVMQGVHDLHQDAGHPLSYYHFGGDEVPEDAWKGSPICQEFMENMGFEDNADLKRYFFETVVNASKAVDTNMGLAAWEDGIMDENEVPFPVDDTTEVYTNCWSNVWEWGHGERAYKFANADYKVVISHATHLYFDHPHEPDPYERGYYWATRFTGAEKTFGYMPDDIYANIDIDRMGNPITEEEVCPDGGCEELQSGKEQNILGMQSQLWSETTRSEEILHGMILQRLLSFAERAWHKAEWETIADSADRNAAKREDWVQFANLLGYHELGKLGRSYHLRPPGGIINDADQLVARAEFPGLTVQYSINNEDWQDFSTPVTLPEGSHSIRLRTRSADGNRYSIEATLQVQITSRSSHIAYSAAYFLFVSLLTLTFLQH